MGFLPPFYPDTLLENDQVKKNSLNIGQTLRSFFCTNNL